MRGDAVDLIVGGHHRADLPLPYGGFVGWEQFLPQHPLGVIGGTAVRSRPPVVRGRQNVWRLRSPVPACR